MTSKSNSFSPFMAFPADIHSLILSACPDNDLTCLRLTCKYLYNLSPRKDIIHLNNKDCVTCIPLENDVNSWASAFEQQRQNCHQSAYEAVCKRNKELGLPAPEIRLCPLTSRIDHCKCFGRRKTLHAQLRGWVPKKLKYCNVCVMYTERKKGSGGRCYHGNPKPRKSTQKFWKHRAKKGAFGYSIWMKWFNNAAMNRYESRLRSGRAKRGGHKRYALRELRPVEVNTKLARDSVSNR